MSALAPVAAPSRQPTLNAEHLRYLKDPEFVAFAQRHLALARKTKPQIRWTPERVKFLQDNYPNMILPVLTRTFNKTFDLNVTEKAIGFQLTWRDIRKSVRPTVGPAAKKKQAA